MYSEIRIERFRGIKELSVQQMSLINVFFGKNNCGKSSLLEAIFLVSGQSNPHLPLNINFLRGYNSILSIDDIALDFYDLDISKPITIQTSGEDRKMRIDAIQSSSNKINLQDKIQISTQSLENYFGYKIRFGDNNSSEIIINADKTDEAKIKTNKSYIEQIKATILNPRILGYQNIGNSITKIIAEKRVDKIINALKCLDERVQDVLVSGKQIMVDVGLSKYLPIEVMGDGFLKLLAILVNIIDNAGGVLLIDEIDNGLHYSAMTQLWHAVIDTAVENNVQLFVTTHNIDSLKGLSTELQNQSYHLDILSAYKLIKQKNDNLVALHYDKNNLIYMINQEIEIR